MDRVQIDGVDYHAREVYDETDTPTGKFELILDENDQPIPSTVCLCHAYEPNECVCGAWDDLASSWYDDY